MNLVKKNILLCSLTALFLCLCSPLFPNLHLFYFAPIIILLIYQCQFIEVLWGSLACGLFLDLLDSDLPFGMYALNYSLCALALVRLRHYFFPDSLSTLPLMVYFFSFISTLVQICLYPIFGVEIFISWKWLKIDLLFMPVLDAFYGFIIFILPSFLFGKKPRSAKDYFMENRR